MMRNAPSLNTPVPSGQTIVGGNASYKVSAYAWANYFHLIGVLSFNEVRLRMRRLSSLIAVMLMVVLSWAMIVDPQSGMSLLSVQNARVLYTSSALAMGSASLLCFLMALIGFYLVRGRVAEDVRSGIGAVIAATPVSNVAFLFSRWLGGICYMVALILTAMISIMLLQLLRGDGPIQIQIYLQTYLLIMGPMIVFSVSAAILFDSVPFLLGKLGDILYFFMWMAQISILSKIESLAAGAISSWLLVDFSGLVTTVLIFKMHMLVDHISIGASSFDPKLAAITLPNYLWNGKFVLIRICSALTAFSLMLPAFVFFHRFSVDKIKPSQASRRRTPLEVMNQWTKPLAKYVHPLFVFAARSRGFMGQVLADVALGFVQAPFVILLVLVVNLMSIFLPISSLSGLTVFAVLCWGIVVSDISTRDFQSAIESMTASTPGGASRQFLRHVASAGCLGLIFVGIIVGRLCFTSPHLALTLLSGIACYSACASLLGKLSLTSKTFLSLYLFGLYIVSQTSKLGLMDTFGFNGVATYLNAQLQFVIGLIVLLVGYVYTHWRAR
ncbi:hypothetical protein [Undibacterium fentianense]|uniref:Uncharacterized protein n=1 Tax=Undibacterium fentianense TaxID=2828728 RepID=A0A941IFI2_9BURK|nr:hypothetical protein [Undibacterium fentianense]MBR7799065.1 hypothetical protein [Undibacterium fentianense]